MALLDRFRAQSGHKHPDAAVRLAFVQEVPLDERELLTEVAREDADPRVRRAAVAKLMDPPALAASARDDVDEGVRAQAVTMLRDIALEAFEGAGEPESLAAVDALVDAKALVVIAKSAPRESAALRALGRVTDGHMLGSIARYAEHESVRRAAFETLEDHAEILSVALNSEFKDPTAAAVERISDRAELDQIAARAKNKGAAKRARAIVREMDERAAQAAQAAQEEAAAAVAAAAAAAVPPPPMPDPAELERAAREEADRQAIADRVRAEHAERARQQEEAAARRREEQAAAERRREEQAAAERARVEAADEAARKESARRSARLAELADEAARALALDDLPSARRQFNLLRREWSSLIAGTPGDADVTARYAQADAAFTARDAAAHEADQRARQETLIRVTNLLARVEPLVALADLTLKVGERALRDVRAALGGMPPLPSRRDYEDSVRRLRAVQAALTPKVQELRDVADWQRWANIGIQEQLCEKMEALKAIEDPEEIAKHVRDFQEQWRQAADVPRAQGEALWRRFKAAHDAAWARCEAHFAAQAEVRAANLATKVTLCERAEALADSTRWIQTADEIKKLQAEWKTIGQVSRGQEKAIWERFRAACDRFFTRRHADLAERKTMWAENLAKKEALSAKVEALAASSDWEATAAEIKRLQNEWKAIGPVKKSRSEALWQRFRGACDHFFARYAQRHDIAKAERVAAREAICAELEALAAPPPVEALPVTSQPSADFSPESVNPGSESAIPGSESAIPGSESAIPGSESAIPSSEPAIPSPESAILSSEPAILSSEPAILSSEPAIPSPESAIPSPESAIPSPESAIPSPESAIPSHESAIPSPESAMPSPGSAIPSAESAIPNPPSAIEEPPADLMARVRALRSQWQQELAARGVDRDRAVALDERFASAFARVLMRWPSVFGGTDLDPDANRRKMEALVRRMEDLATSLTPGGFGAGEAALSPTTRLAAMLKDALAANTIGGKVDEESRFRAANDEVRQAQAALSRLGPVPEAARRPLADRFQRAVRRITDAAGSAGRVEKMRT